MPSDKTPLEDSRLDLTADHVFTVEVNENDVASYLDGECEMSDLLEDTVWDEARAYTQLENKDAMIVITIKARS